MSRSDKKGSVASRSDDGEGEGANRSAALSQKAALQLPFPGCDPTREKVAQKRPQAFLSHKL